ncbi:oxygen-dependent protoporphyrinogen oxidase [Agromyces sp. 3263]|uniref:protoporphyrinogen/coproporphyrinogen oxidase n=1 Tax=Agromyces sp. 3263 TaxID=2817750 RepID=UPI002857C8AA|nr:FAD-dependent oxidoreductase [Agromyces sp. 3263]MDR6905645.1 oxygen-dependent protoporphyrinogen oxidase [Agromyces sp. 3263]
MTGGSPRAGASVGDHRTADVVVVGAGVGGLVAALECARVGLRVTVLERRATIGGCVGRIELDGLTLDSGAESFATRGGTVAELVEQLGLADEVVTPNPAGAWLVMPGATGGIDAAPMPRTGVLGIPANPLGEDVRRIIGWRGAIRAYRDRVTPILKIGRAHSLGKLVRQRMGDAVADRLVTPISAGVYSADPDDLDLDVVAPGLNEAMTRAGSLSGGVGQLLEARKAGTAVLGLGGGMHRLVDALAVQLDRFGVEVVTGAEVTGLERRVADGAADAAGAPGWRVQALLAPVSGTASAVAAAATPADSAPAALQVDAPYVILASPADASRRLLEAASLGWADASAWPAAASVELVTLVLDAPALAAAPRGTGVLVAVGTPGVTAKALTHSTAKWPWLAEAAGAREVVRLSYGRAGEPNPLDGRSDAEVEALALADASALLGTPLDASMLRASGRSAWRDALSQATIGQRDRIRALEEVLAAEPGIEATGSWVAGTGLASVIPHAQEAARRIRHLAITPGEVA